jgi:hypothetical protein
MSFAALRDRVNANALSKLNDGQALIGQVVGIGADMLGTAVTAVFDAEFLAVLEVESNTPPVLRVSSTDVPGIAHGISVIFNAVNYTVAEVHQDSQGITNLILEKS